MVNNIGGSSAMLKIFYIPNATLSCMRGHESSSCVYTIWPIQLVGIPSRYYCRDFIDLMMRFCIPEKQCPKYVFYFRIPPM